MNNIFIQNKYTNWYMNIVESAKRENRVKSKEQYFEKHHIIPKSIVPNNDVVLLTAKEHFLCHLLLPHMVDKKYKNKMYYGIKIMSEMKNSNQPRYTSRSYSIIKYKISQAKSEDLKGKPNLLLKGKPRPNWVKDKLKKSFSKSEKHKAACLENLKKATIANIGIPRPEYLKLQWSNKLKGIPKSENIKEKLKIAAQERTKIRCCCKNCKKELPTNSLGSHKRSCK